MSPFIMTVMTGVICSRRWAGVFYFFFFAVGQFPLLGWARLSTCVYTTHFWGNEEKKNLNIITTQQYNLNVLSALARIQISNITTFPKTSTHRRSGRNHDIMTVEKLKLRLMWLSSSWAMPWSHGPQTWVLGFTIFGSGTSGIDTV
jgi:hypothetical protein